MFMSACLDFKAESVVPNRRKIRHVDVIFGSKCSHVWMGGEKGDVWGQARGRAGLKNGAVYPEHGICTG
jgi:hypothetical protein